MLRNETLWADKVAENHGLTQNDVGSRNDMPDVNVFLPFRDKVLIFRFEQKTNVHSITMNRVSGDYIYSFNLKNLKQHDIIFDFRQRIAQAVLQEL